MAGPLKNSRHEQFSVLVAGGSTQADAHRAVWPGSKRWKDKSVWEKASKLAAKVEPRVKELQAKVADAVVIEKAEALTILAEVLKMAPKDVKSDSRFAQEMRVNPVTGEVTIRLPSKIAAFSELAKVLGWYAPQKVEGSFAFRPDAEVFQALRGAAGKD